MTASTLSAADTNTPPAAAPPPMTPQEMFEGGTNSYNNWIEFSTGGFITSGNKGQFQQAQQSVAGPFGGISDFHYQRDLDKTTTLTADGHALFDQHDYKLSLGLTREKLGYLRVSYNEFRTWSNGDGGFNPPTDTFYPLRGDALGLDRGELTFEGGLTLENLPKITFKYTHTFREGDQASTSWGYTHPSGGSSVRGLSPSFYGIDEHSDAFQLDVTHHIKSTDFGVGVRYETGNLNDALNITQFPGEPVQQKITDRENTGYDLFNAHAFTETWLKRNLMFSSGYSYSDTWSDFSGSRIYGQDFGAPYMPALQNGFGYYGLDGHSHMQEYVMDLNLFSRPSPHFTIVPSVRAQKEDLDANATGVETFAANSPADFQSTSDRGVIDVRERLDLTYTGLTNWVFNARGEWTEGSGDLTERGGLGPINGFSEFQPIQFRTDDHRFFQKYSLGAKWYPDRRVTLAAGGYYKNDHYDYSPTTNDTSFLYPGFLTVQDMETYDGNLEMTLRPCQNVTLVSRYEYQWSTIQTGPNSLYLLPEAESSTMQSHILGENISWVPWSRLSLQLGFNYVLSTTKTPVSGYVPTGLTAAPILAAQNNYWTLNFSSSLVLDDKTDLNLGYFYYRADDYQNNADVGVPYGAGAEEHGVTAAIVRRISKNIRLTVKYGFYHYTDQLSGGNDNYDAHLLYSSLQYRF